VLADAPAATLGMMLVRRLRRAPRRAVMARPRSANHAEVFRRTSDAADRPDLEGLLAVIDPRVEWYPAMAALLRGEPTVYRGHEGVAAWLRDQEESFAESRIDYSEIRVLGERVVAIGRLRARGKESGAEIESPVGWVVDFKNGKVIRAQAYLDHQDALDAARVSE
jgi:ketosteroid isomerase-like protein